MTPRRLLHRRTSTPVRVTSSLKSGPSLPNDVMLQTCRRVGIVSLVFASLWAFIIVMNNFVVRLLGHAAVMDALWPFPGVLVATTGVVTSVLMVYLARRLSPRPQLLLDVGSGFLVVQCLFISVLSEWEVVPMVPRVSWVCVAILLYPQSCRIRPGRSYGPHCWRLPRSRSLSP